jgi:hypothetical protein
MVRRHALAVLDGKATRVAAAIRRAATLAGLDEAQRAGADACAVYLTNKARYLDYPTALGNGWPIATGVIEGAMPASGEGPDGSHRPPLTSEPPAQQGVRSSIAGQPRISPGCGR